MIYLIEILCGFLLSFLELEWLRRQTQNFFESGVATPGHWRRNYLARLGIVAFFLFLLIRLFRNSLVSFLVSFFVSQFVLRSWHSWRWRKANE